MSKTEDREQHSRRIHQKQTAIDKNTKVAKQYGIDVSQPHRFAKHHPTNCGVPGCTLCANPRRTFKQKTMQERSANQPMLHDLEVTDLEEMREFVRQELSIMEDPHQFMSSVLSSSAAVPVNSLTLQQVQKLYSAVR